jgi:hypothetical protein
MYYQDRLAGQGFARVLLGGTGRMPGAVEVARAALEERLDTRVEPIGPSDVLTAVAGMLMRTRREAVAV